ncbi:2Fe-2S iron-sulfur cluster-binding protein [Sphingomonas sp. MMS24-JH45]
MSCLALRGSIRRACDRHHRGLAEDDALHPLQASFVEHDGFQCGYCTPGRLAIGMASEIERGVPSHVSADLSADARWTREEIRRRMSGNLCRCGAHNGIVDAIRATFGAEASA